MTDKAEMPKWIAARLMRYLPKGAREQGDWIKLDSGEAVDGNEYAIYVSVGVHTAEIEKLGEQLKALIASQAAEIKQLRKHLEFNVDANEKHWAEIERLRETISAKDVEIERLRGDTL